MHEISIVNSQEPLSIYAVSIYSFVDHRRRRRQDPYRTVDRAFLTYPVSNTPSTNHPKLSQIQQVYQAILFLLSLDNHSSKNPQMTQNTLDK